MTQQTIGIGAVAGDGTGDPARTAFNKVNENFTELYASAAGVAAATVAILASGLYPASFTSLLASDHMVLASTKKLYLDGVGGVGGDSYIVESSANVVDHYVGGVNALRLTAAGVAVTGTLSATGQTVLASASGNVGVGVTPSAWNTGNSIRAIEMGGGSLFSYSNSEIDLIGNAIYDAVDWKYKASNFATRYVQYGGAHSWHTAPSGVAGNSVTWTKRLELDSSGLAVTGALSASAEITSTTYTRFLATASYTTGNPCIFQSVAGLMNIGAGSAGFAVNNTAHSANLLTLTAAGLMLPATAKFYPDGGGDTYLVESSANVLDMYAGGTKTLSLATTGATITGTVSTTDPAGGAGPAWKLGVAAAVSPTAPNRTLRVDIAGTSYYLAAKTTND